jgi:tetratricopeptide (TPR) repeat protein
LCRQAQQQWSRYTEEGLTNAILLYSQAISKDTNYALAYVGLANCYYLLAFEARRPGEVLPQAIRNTERALALDDSLADAHVARGAGLFFFEWEWEGARKELERAQQLDPDNDYLHHIFAHYFECLGKWDQALAHWKSACEVDPLSALYQSEWGLSLCFAGRPDEAMPHLTKANQLKPDRPENYLNLAWAYELKGDYAEALRILNEGQAKPGGDSSLFLADLAFVQAKLGRYGRIKKTAQSPLRACFKNGLM